MPFAHLAAGLTLSALAAPTTSHPSKASQTIALVQKSIAVADEVWPHAKEKYQRAKIVVTDGQEIIALENNQISHPSQTIFPKDMNWDTVGYDFGKNGELYFVSPVKDRYNPDFSFTAAETASTIMHENFHNLIQADKWKVHTDDISSIYPVQSKARAYRYDILNCLYDALIHPQHKSKALGQAKYFYEAWKKEFPDDCQSAIPYDIIEGSARFFEKKVELLATTPKSKIYSPQAINSFITSHSKDLNFDLGTHTEGYMMGFLSGMLLDQSSLKEQWRTQLPQGVTPEAILLKDVTPVRAKLSVQSLSAVKEYKYNIDESVSKYLNPTFAVLDKGQPLMSFSKQTIGSEISQGHFKRISDKTLDIHYVAVLSGKYQTKQGIIQINDTTLIRKNKSSEVFLPIEPAWVKKVKGELVVYYPKLHRTFKVKESKPLGRSKVYALL